MKVIWTLYTLLFWQAYALGQDLPNPAANLQTMPQDSYVIAMDNTWQATTGTNPSFRNFNLKVYGLIVHLLNNNIRVKRVIRAGKQKEGIDFSVACRQIKPSPELNPVQRDFKAGPFVIFGSDLLRVNINELIDAYNSNAGGLSGITHDTAKVRVYKTVSDVTVDVRHDLTGFRPKAAVLSDGGKDPYGVPYWQIHLNYMTLAGIPISNYAVGAGQDLAANCFTFSSEPHNDYQMPAVVSSIQAFVQAGGNFLAQCAAIPNYEALGRFQSSGGITVANITPSAVYYPNADLSMAQIEGNFGLRQGGSCQNWRYGASSFSNHAHAFAANTNGFVNNTSLIGAAASKLTATNLPGGMVFYLGNHSFSNINDYNHLNGMRMYLNALLTPTGVKNILSYSFDADCNASAMKVASYNGPTNAYPVQFYLYEDKGAVRGSVDPGDPFIGATTVYSPGTQAYIPMFGSDPNADYVMNVVPNASCFKPEQVMPSPCRLITLSAALKNFTAVRNGNDVLLRWQTLSEQENDGFFVEQRVNNEWRDIGFVPSMAAGGNSNSKLSYQFVAEARFSGTAEFRIRMQSLKKTVHYSEVRQVQAEASREQFSIYPNPAVNGRTEIFFATKERRSVAVYDMAGRLVSSTNNITSASFTLPVLRSGAYLVKVTDAAGAVQSEKLVVN